jgi:hypothetical protein
MELNKKNDVVFDMWSVEGPWKGGAWVRCLLAPANSSKEQREAILKA